MDRTGQGRPYRKDGAYIGAPPAHKVPLGGRSHWDVTPAQVRRKRQAKTIDTGSGRGHPLRGVEGSTLSQYGKDMSRPVDTMRARRQVWTDCNEARTASWLRGDIA